MPSTDKYRAHAIAAGILFIIATAFLFVGEALYKPGLSPPNILQKAANARSQISAGILIEFLCVLAIPLIPVVLYPILRLVSPVLAIGYVAFRLFEAALFAGMEITKILVLALSKQVLANPSTPSDGLELLATALVGGDAWSGTSGPIYNLVFVSGMLMLNWMLWKSRLVPRWIAIWGMISALALGGIAVAVFFTTVSETIAIPLIAPLAIQEMVLALWFIFKGFDGEALARLEG